LAALSALLFAATAAAQTAGGRLAGTVVDFAGKPQMGATVWVASQGIRHRAALQLRTNQAGRFLQEKLPAGAYTVRVTLPGFMPALSSNVVVSANATTVVKFELDSLFSSLAGLRQPSQQAADADDWEWVLRTSADTRPVLRWLSDDGSGSVAAGERAPRKTPRARVELTSGGIQPGGFATPLTQSAFAYDQSIGVLGKLFLAGQFSYDAGGTAGVATTWVPFGTSADAPRTTVVLNQYRLGEQGPMLRTLRSEQSGSAHLGDRVTIHYSAEYVWLSFRGSASSVRPRADVSMKLAKGWSATLSAGSRPVRGQLIPTDLEFAMGQLETFPAVMFHDGSPVIEGAWHEELRLAHKTTKNGEFAVAVFRDHSPSTPVFAALLSDGALPLDSLLLPHAVDGGALSSYGARLAYRQKISSDLETVFVYAWAGTLSANDLSGTLAFRDSLQQRSRHSLAARLAGRFPRSGTRLAVDYKWVNGPAVARQDAYGEILYDLDPYLNVKLRQPLPPFFGYGRLEAVADLLNVIGEGSQLRYTPDGRLSLSAAPRVLRGGLSFQF
jgi:hypothetical protein